MMSNLGKPEFEFPLLCSIFGIRNVQRAMVTFPHRLRFLESSLSFLYQKSKELVSDETSLF